MTEEADSAPEDAVWPERVNPFIMTARGEAGQADSVRSAITLWVVIGSLVVGGFVLTTPSELDQCKEPSLFIVRPTEPPESARFCVYEQARDGSLRRTDICAADPSDVREYAQFLAAATEQEFVSCKARLPSPWMATWRHAVRTMAKLGGL